MSSKIVPFGGAGLAGKALCRESGSADRPVAAVDTVPCGGELRRPGIECTRGDNSSADQMLNLSE